MVHLRISEKKQEGVKPEEKGWAQLSKRNWWSLVLLQPNLHFSDARQKLLDC